VAEPQAAPHPAEVVIELEDQVVEPGAQPLEQPVPRGEPVELVAVNDEEPAAVGFVPDC